MKTKEIIKVIAEAAEEFQKTALDPKAKVRNRGDCAVPAEHPKNKSNKDRYPVNTKEQAYAALRYANKTKKSPSWWDGSMQELLNTIVRKVHKNFPSIEISEKSKHPGKD